MKILTFDTSLNKTYLTYGEDKNILISKEISSDEEKYHSVYLVPAIIEVLKSQNITMNDIDVIGINVGPGSFTGIRICTVIARVAAQQADIKVVPVSSLEILSKINSSDKKSVVFLDARKNKVYTAQYDENGREILSPCLIPCEDIQNVLENGDFNVISDASMSKYLAEKGIESVNYENGNYPLGKFLYEITLEKIKTDNDFHWAKAKPLYIQPPSITPSKKAGV